MLQMMFFSFGGSILTLKHKICLELSGLPMAVFWQCGTHVLRYEEKEDFRVCFFTAAMYEAIAKIKCGVIFFKQM